MMSFGGFPGQMPSDSFNMWGHHGMTGLSPAYYHHQAPVTNHVSSSVAAAPRPAAAPGAPSPDTTQEQQKISGMTPLVFGGMPNAAGMPHAPGGFAHHHPSQLMHPMRNIVNHNGQIYQAMSTDSQGDHQNMPAPAMAAPAPLQMQVPPPMLVNSMMLQPGMSSVPLQEPKKWVRWSEQEDQHLRRAVQAFGEHNFKLISERVFHGSRSEVQCKNRWKKALQPGLVKGRWSKEEDAIIINAVNNSEGPVKWAEIAKSLPGRIGEQVKEHWYVSS